MKLLFWEFPSDLRELRSRDTYQSSCLRSKLAIGSNYMVTRCLEDITLKENAIFVIFWKS